MLALRGRNAALLSSLSAHSTSDGLDTRIAWAHRANARASQINPFADLAGRAARLGLGVAKLEQGGHVVKTVCDRRLRSLCNAWMRFGSCGVLATHRLTTILSSLTCLPAQPNMCGKCQ